MIVIYYSNQKVTKIVHLLEKKEISKYASDIVETFFSLSKEYPNNFILWCHEKLYDHLNYEGLKTIFDSSQKMISYSLDKGKSFLADLGYIDQNNFLKINRDVTFPTWAMSSHVGGIHASSVARFNKESMRNVSFSMFLNQISKQGVSQGLLCYSEPSLINDKINFKEEKCTKKELFFFVKNHYRKRWRLILLFNLFIYTKHLYLFSFICSFFSRKIVISKHSVETNSMIDASSSITSRKTLDVIIPTLGRANYLKDVLLDLSGQTFLPTKVIIIEQCRNTEDKTQLNYLTDEWPFEIDHHLIHQLGACNARNIALTKVTSEWVFFADDDVRFEKDLIENSFKCIKRFNANAITLSCLQKGELEAFSSVHQWDAFGSCSSIVKSCFIKNIRFDMAFEFGYGEDNDFGMQLRNRGCDILYVPNIKMLHLKAPVGGFRSPIKQKWDNDFIIPKPSPTVMVYNLKHLTLEQLRCYKTILFYKFYRIQKTKNPYKYIKLQNKRWAASVKWGHKLMNHEV